MIDRMMRAAMLDSALYAEVEHDTRATSQAALVVVLTAVAAGIGTLTGGVVGLLAGILLGLGGWALYAAITYYVGTRVFAGPETQADWGELLRTLGFASSPRVLLILAFLPVIGLLIGVGVLIWTLATTVVAIRQALDFDTGRAIATALSGWVVLLVTSVVVGAILTF